jgi:CRP-like cAMP-binding protein
MCGRRLSARTFSTPVEKSFPFMVDPFFAPLIRRWEQRSALSDQHRGAIAALPHSRRTVERDGYLVRDGDVPSHCHLLISGFAYRHKVIANGARQILSIHMRGEFVDLENLLLERADHNVQVLNRAEIVAIPRPALQALAQNHPGLARAMWLDTMIDASIHREWVVNVGRRDATSRVAHLLCELSLRIEAAGVADKHRFDLPLTQEQIADCAGLTAVHVNRVLRSLRDDGLIHLNLRSLKIVDWAGLCTVGDFNDRYLHPELGTIAPVEAR